MILTMHRCIRILGAPPKSVIVKVRRRAAVATSNEQRWSSTSSSYDHRSKLHVGFASSLFDSPPLTSNDGESSTDAPIIETMLTAIRSGVSNFDCPAPPSPMNAGVTSCWRANRESEVRIITALEHALEKSTNDGTNRCQLGVSLTSRLGYRSALISSSIDRRSKMADNDRNEAEGTFDGDSRAGTTTTEHVALVHNLSEDYVLHSLQTSPLVQKYRDNDNISSRDKTIQLVSLAHNPETQIAAFLSSKPTATIESARAHMKRRLTSAFVGYEIAVDRGWIDTYGVDSNGLGLPDSHDMHINWRDVLECAAEAYLEASVRCGDDRKYGRGRSSCVVIRLPGNLLETRGLMVAEEIRAFLSAVADDSDKGPLSDELQRVRDALPGSVDVIMTRPLSAYPHGGTGWGSDSEGGSLHNVDASNPIRLVDYLVDPIVEVVSTGNQPTQIWTNEHYSKYGVRPVAYQSILNTALSHFDADEILEVSHDRELTAEERETLDGCKLLRDMIHDLDASLDSTRSFDAYEAHLINFAVPLIHGTFEELDEESARILQLFFRAHGMAARLAVARWTRDMVLAGWKTKKDGDKSKKDPEKETAISHLWKTLGFDNFDGGYDLPDDITLQEFALKQLLKDDAVRGVVIGCSNHEHVSEAIRAADMIKAVLLK